MNEWDEWHREQKREWWRLYNAYLLTPIWRAKRALVLDRADNLCEGCLDDYATQVHHRRYPQNCLPGSPEWIAQEKLFDLVAVCDECHEDIHSF